MKTKTIRQSVTFRTTPHVIYEMLMDSRKHARFTGERASISRKVGGKFTAYNRILAVSTLSLCRTRRLFSHGGTATGRRVIFPR